MKLVIEHYPWIEGEPYGVFLRGNDKPILAKKFKTEQEARAYCEARISGRKVIAEFELPDGA